MVIKNKKGEMLKAFLFISIFSIISISAIFSFYMFYVSGNNFIAIPLLNAGNATGFNETLKESILVPAGEAYQATNLHLIDWGFLLSLVIMTGSSLSLSYYSKNLGYYKFLSILTYGEMFLLFIVGMVESYTNWLYNILINLFPTLVIDLPVFNWFLNNIGVYVLVLVSLMLLLNQLDFDFAVINRRKDKERNVLDQDEVM